VTVTWSKAASPGVSLHASATTPKAGETVTLTAEANEAVTGSGYEITIADQTMGGIVIAHCSIGTICQAKVSESSATSQRYIAEVANQIETKAQSVEVTVTWSKAASPGVSLHASATTPKAGETVTLTAEANEAVTGSGYEITIADQTMGGIVIARCSTGRACQATLKEASATSQRYIAAVANQIETKAQSREVTVTWSKAASSGVSLHASTTTPKAGETVTLTAEANESVTGSGYEMTIADQTTGGIVIANCLTGRICRVTVAESSAISQRYIAEVANEIETKAQSRELIVTWSKAT